MREENKAKILKKAADQMTVQIYAAMAIALHRTCGFGYERINRVFLESQHIWEDFAGKADNMVKLCKEETGGRCNAKGSRKWVLKAK